MSARNFQTQEEQLELRYDDGGGAFVHGKVKPEPPAGAPRIIGLCGGIGCGKSTTAAYLIETYGYVRRRFALKLKQVVHDVYSPMGLEWRHVDGTQADKNEPLPGILKQDGTPWTGRGLLEDIGTRGFRGACPSTWVDNALLSLDAWDLVVFEDCRFPNEFQAIRAAGGAVWEVVKVGGAVERTGHVSDEAWRELPKDAHLVARSGDIEALYRGTDLLLANGGLEYQAVRLVGEVGKG